MSELGNNWSTTEAECVGNQPNPTGARWAAAEGCHQLSKVPACVLRTHSFATSDAHFTLTPGWVASFWYHLSFDLGNPATVSCRIIEILDLAFCGTPAMALSLTTGTDDRLLDPWLLALGFQRVGGSDGLVHWQITAGGYGAHRRARESRGARGLLSSLIDRAVTRLTPQVGTHHFGRNVH
jgi:hypothetical protein